MAQNVSPETELTAGAMMHPGQGRAVNEDSLGLPKGIPQATLARKGHLYIVADGIGGHQAGDVASQMAADLTQRTYYEDPNPDIAVSLQHAIAAANTHIYRQAQEPAYAQMGATVIAAVVRGGELVVANVGDSRAYLLRDGSLQRLTTDHTWVAERVAAGILTPEEAAHHDMRHVIIRSLGDQPTVEVDVRSYRLLPGDQLLLCTDGVWEPLSEAEMGRLLGQRRPQAAAAALVSRAAANGGADDATALVVAARPVGAGVLDQLGQAVTEVLASPQQRVVLGGIGAVLVLALVCGLEWRLIGGLESTVQVSSTPITAMTDSTSGELPTATPTTTPNPSPTSLPTLTKLSPSPSTTTIPEPSPTVSSTVTFSVPCSEYGFDFAKTGVVEPMKGHTYKPLYLRRDENTGYCKLPRGQCVGIRSEYSGWFEVAILTSELQRLCPASSQKYPTQGPFSVGYIPAYRVNVEQ